MRKPQIDPVKLNKMLSTGKSSKECAEFFSVSSAAISQAKKKLSVNVVKNVAMENAHRVVDKNLNAVDQLQDINKHANKLLDELMSLNKLKDSSKKEKMTPKEARELALKTMSEIRGQLKLQLEIFQCLYDMEAVQEFQKEVLTIIGDVAPDVRDRIIHNLGKKRAIRRAAQFD